MGLNIKNPEAHQLAREVASLTGESLSAAVTEALRERLARLKNDKRGDLAERLLAIGRDCAAHLPEGYRELDHDALLYDERGLPK
jgi:antitoxin VapB